MKISEKIYGREKEINALQAAFSKVCKGEFRILIVSGSSGTGKTTLVNKALTAAVREKSISVSGKFEQYNRDEPYVPFIQAFRSLIRRLLTEPKPVIEKQKKKLMKVLGSNGALVTELIPEIEFIVGKLPAVVEAEPQKVQRRFEQVFKRFLEVFASAEQPVVLFIDDLQWADLASLHLFRSMCQNPGNAYILIIGAYREEEVDEAHPLRSTLKEIEEDGIKPETIRLKNFTHEQTVSMVADSLQDAGAESSRLAGIIHRKTLGNAFFIVQMLQHFCDEKHLCFNEREDRWEWDIEHISGMTIPEDIVEIVINKLSKLPVETLNALRLASVIGNSFTLEMLAIVSQCTLEKTMDKLSPALAEGLLLPEEDPEEPLRTADIQDNKDAGPRFEFLHDRIQQAVYAQITESERKELDFKIGRLLLNSADESDLGKTILSIMAHFNNALELVTDCSERISLARYNLAAGKKAMAAVAFTSALKYFESGRLLLTENSWRSDYGLSSELNLGYANTLFLCGSINESYHIFDILLAKAKTGMETAKILGAKANLFSSVGDYEATISTGIEALKNLGENIPERPGKTLITILTIKSMWYFRKSRVKNILNMKENHSPETDKVLELLISMALASNLINPDLFAVIALKIAILSIKHGNTKYAPYGYAGYGIIAGSVLGNYKKSCLLKKAAAALCERYDDVYIRCIVNFVDATFINHWIAHGSSSQEYFSKGILYGIEAGEYIFAVSSAAIQTEFNYCMGMNLEELRSQIQSAYELGKRLKCQDIAEYLQCLNKIVSGIMSGNLECFEQENIKLQMGKNSNDMMMYFLLKMQAYYLSEKSDEVFDLLEKAQKNMDAVLGLIQYAEHLFYHSLIITANYHQLPDSKKRKYRSVLKHNISRFKQWQDNCPENFRHKYLLLTAEYARINGKSERVADLYHEAAKSAEQNGFLQNEAIICELAGRYYADSGKDRIAATYLADACKKYRLWGAEGKEKALKKRYEHLINRQEAKNPACGGNLPEAEKQYTERLDSAKILEEIKSLSRETDMKILLEKFLDIIVQTSNADKGFILIEKNEELYIEACKEGIELPVKSLDIPLEEYEGIPKKLIRYTARTYEIASLSDERLRDVFLTDSYIIRNNTASALCLPLIVQEIFSGALYLEKSMNAEEFSEEGIEAIKVLSCQVLLMRKLQNLMENEAEAARISTNAKVIEQLTTREMEILRHMATGKSNGEIAQSTGLTVNTIKTHVLGIYGKLGVNRRAQAAIWARDLRIS
jgi:histidine kinase